MYAPPHSRLVCWSFWTIVSLNLAICLQLRADNLDVHWHELSVPGASRSPTPSIQDVAAEERGTVWITANQKVFYWTGQEFREPTGDKLTSGMWASVFCGGQDRPLFINQQGRQLDRKEQVNGREYARSRLYHLSDGQATFITELDHHDSGNSPSLAVTPQGHICHWTNSVIETFDGKTWQRIAVKINRNGVMIVNGPRETHLLADGDLYTVNAQAKISQRRLVGFTPDGFDGGTLWGDERLLGVFGRVVRCWSIQSGVEVDVSRIFNRPNGFSVVDLQRVPDGRVLLITTIRGTNKSQIQLLTPEGEVQSILGLADVDWTPGYSSERRLVNSALWTKDGVLWLASPHQGVWRIERDKREVFGWKEGVPLNDCHRVVQDEAGRILAASHQGIYSYRPDQPARHVADPADQWTEFRLSRSVRPIRDNAGSIWCCLADQSEMISRWDGERWHQYAVPLDTKTTYRALTDDRGHLLMQEWSDRDCFDVSSEGVEKFRNLASALEAAVKRGARLFTTDRGFQGCVVKPGGKIWAGLHLADVVHHFDGIRWHTFELPDNGEFLYDSPRFGVVIGTSQGEYLIPDGAGIRPNGKYTWLGGMWGSGRVRIHDEDHGALRHNGLVQVIMDSRHDRYLTTPDIPDPSQPPQKFAFRNGDRWPNDLNPHTLRFGRWDSPWAGFEGGQLYRLCAGKVVPFLDRNSPFQGKLLEVGDVLEDRNGNVWFHHDAGGYQRLLMRRMGRFQLNVSPLPDRTAYSTTLEVESQSLTPGRPVRLFWRLGGSPWTGGGTAGCLRLPLLKPGRYSVEVVGMDELGCFTPQILRIPVEVPE
ncbi:MAG: hypothetical protein HZA46_02725 [Planctomycetales bacterium]|nr:hypothetical protein [Planctomycetales bacterium]